MSSKDFINIFKYLGYKIRSSNLCQDKLFEVGLQFSFYDMVMYDL